MVAFARYMEQVATYWAPVDHDGFGGRTFAAPVLIKCRWQDVATLFRDAQGQQAISDAVVYVDRALDLRGYIALGDFTTTGLDVDAQAVANAFTTSPTASRARQINAVIRTLKEADAWDTWVGFYVSAAADQQAANINWKSPTTFTSVPNGNPTFIVDGGFFGDGIDDFLNTGISPISIPALTPSNITLFGLSLGYAGIEPAAFEPLVGAAGGLTIQRTSTSSMSAQIASPNAAQIFTTQRAGLFSASGSGVVSMQMRHYLDNVLRSGGGSPGSIPSGTFCGLRNGLTGGFGPFELAAYGIGGYLTEAKHTALYNALTGYMSGVMADYIDPTTLDNSYEIRQAQVSPSLMVDEELHKVFV